MKILVSDFDNVFFDENFESNIDLVNQFVDAGNMFIISTGRSLDQLQKTIDSYYIKISYFICNDGATIYDQFLNIIYRKDIDQDSVKPIFNMLYNDPNNKEVFIDTTNGLVNDITRSANRIIARFLDRNKAKEGLKRVLCQNKNITGYLSKSWINIEHVSVSKGNAIDFLADYYNLDIDKIYTVGNGIHDLSMTKFHSIAIKNSALEYQKRCHKTVARFSDIFKNVKDK